MPIYRVRKYADRNLIKAGGNAPDTAGVGVVPVANVGVGTISGILGVVSASADGVNYEDLMAGVYNAKNLTNSSANGIFTVVVPSGGFINGNIEYTIEATDGTDYQSISSFVTYASVNKGGTVTSTITEVAGNQAKAVSGGTLVPAWTIVNSSGTLTIKVNPTSSLTTTTCRIEFFVAPSIGVITLL